MIEHRRGLTSIATMIALLGLAAPVAAQADPPDRSGGTTATTSSPASGPSGNDVAGGSTQGAGESGEVKAAGAGHDGATEGRAASSEPDLASQRLDQAKRQVELLDAEYQLRLKEKEMELAELELERRALAARAAVEDARRSAEQAEAVEGLHRLEVERAKVEAERNIARLRRDLELDGARFALERTEAERLVDATVQRPVEYLTQPFVDGVLHVSDRRIPLNGPITSDTADAVTEAISFLNNSSQDLPIFIVIDDSPGGSVMAGYRIMTAMQSSRAPIHVVVKSFAASMAATILTTAEHSYAYPNAIILHHQLLSGTYGNVREAEKQVAVMNEWYRRLVSPVCAKIGMTQEQFVNAMYAHDPNGDWSEFADEAARLKWVDHVVRELREEGVNAVGDARAKVGSRVTLTAPAEATQGVEALPDLGPFDAWFIYAPAAEHPQGPSIGPRR